MLKEESGYETYPSWYLDEASRCFRLSDPEMNTNRDAIGTRFFSFYTTPFQKILGKQISIDKNQNKDETKGYNLKNQWQRSNIKIDHAHCSRMYIYITNWT